MNKLKKGDKIVLSNGVELSVGYSGTDGSGCHCCDNNICKCYFSGYESGFCNKNYCDEKDGWIDNGPTLVFIPTDESLRRSIYKCSKPTDSLPDDIDIVSINGVKSIDINEDNFVSERYKLKYK